MNTRMRKYCRIKVGATVLVRKEGSIADGKWGIVRSKNSGMVSVAIENDDNRQFCFSETEIVTERFSNILGFFFTADIRKGIKDPIHKSIWLEKFSTYSDARDALLKKMNDFCGLDFYGSVSQNFIMTRTQSIRLNCFSCLDSKEINVRYVARSVTEY